jgi:hypothetical protein
MHYTLVHLADFRVGIKYRAAADRDKIQDPEVILKVIEGISNSPRRGIAPPLFLRRIVVRIFCDLLPRLVLSPFIRAGAPENDAQLSVKQKKGQVIATAATIMADTDVLAYNIATFVTAPFLLEFGADKFIGHTAIVARRINVSETTIGLVTTGAEWEEVRHHLETAPSGFCPHANPRYSSLSSSSRLLPAIAHRWLSVTLLGLLSPTSWVHSLLASCSTAMMSLSVST